MLWWICEKVLSYWYDKSKQLKLIKLLLFGNSKEINSKGHLEMIQVAINFCLYNDFGCVIELFI